MLERYRSSGFALFVYYFFMYVAMAPFTAFLSTYYNEIGLSASQIGVLSGIGPIVVIFGQFVWGRMADRAKQKNTVLLVATLLTGITVYAFSLNPSFLYLLMINIFYNFTNCSIIQLSDSIALEYASGHNLRFSIIRMGGSIGFSCCTLAVGFLLTGDAGKMFAINAVFLLISAIALLFMPKVSGARRDRQKANYRDLFADKKLVVLLCFNFVIYLGYFYNMAFFPVLMAQHGATSMHIGIAQMVSAMCELPFLLLSQKIINRIGLRMTLILSSCAFAMRWLFCGTLTEVWPLVLICSLHGLGHITVSFCTSSYINKTVAQSLRASGQTLLGMVDYGFSKCVASLVGGFLADIWGVSTVYLCLGGSSLLALLILVLFLPKLKIRI